MATVEQIRPTPYRPAAPLPNLSQFGIRDRKYKGMLAKVRDLRRRYDQTSREARGLAVEIQRGAPERHRAEIAAIFADTETEDVDSIYEKALSRHEKELEKLSKEHAAAVRKNDSIGVALTRAEAEAWQYVNQHSEEWGQELAAKRAEGGSQLGAQAAQMVEAANSFRAGYDELLKLSGDMTESAGRWGLPRVSQAAEAWKAANTVLGAVTETVAVLGAAKDARARGETLDGSAAIGESLSERIAARYSSVVGAGFVEDGDEQEVTIELREGEE